MRTDDDGAARLQRDQNLVDGGGGGIRGRDDRADDPERLGDLDDLAILEPIHDADRLHRPNEPIDRLRREQILLDFVGDDAEAGFLLCEPRERLRVRRHRRGHRIDDGVDLLL